MKEETIQPKDFIESSGNSYEKNDNLNGVENKNEYIVGTKEFKDKLIENDDTKT